jgi:ribosome maturation factor RimP
MNFESKLKDYIKEICENLNFKFIETSVHGHKNKYNIKVIADTEEGITLEECQKISREISDIIFRKDLIFGDYRIDVSSPGLDKPLQYDYEYKRNIGRNLIVSYNNENNKITEITGELTNIDADGIVLKIKEESITVKFEKINQAKIKLKW